ncbi:Co-chaperone protein HscB [invertebrate metagenome]|uniref:Co-chaperone protein HscB n=1 Tax=invertebrate metagenome TaxID=1711999 RepID=A0A2H9T924_9ZZZZ
MDNKQNYFELFQLPVSPDVDVRKLVPVYRQLQKTVHPDRFADANAQQQRLAIEYASYVNQAYETLKSPLERCKYLLMLAGHPVDMERNTVSDSAFLMQQMELRESLEDIREQGGPFPALDQLMHTVAQETDGYFHEFQLWWEANHIQWEQVDFQQADSLLRKMQFMVKLTAEMDELDAELMDR